MAEANEEADRSEEPTRRKLDEAIKRGDVARSAEVNTFLVLGGFTLALLVAGGPAARGLALDLRGFLANAHAIPATDAALSTLLRRAVAAALAAAAFPVGILALAGLAGAALQHRPLWTFEPLKPQGARISPLAGMKRLLGGEAMVQFVKGLAKIAIVGVASGAVLWAERDRLDGFARLDPAALAGAILTLALKLMGAVLAVYAFLAVGDALYQRFSWLKRQRMSKRELKEEYRETEGNPEIKARLRQIRAARLRKRMMAAVPQATVVITNPTHYAVALRYETGMAAPVCVAKGLDHLALRIREVAASHGVAIVENPPLARALHASVEVDDEIPVDHYKAVAEVIGYVLRLKRRAS